MHNPKRSIDHVDDSATSRSVKTPRTDQSSLDGDEDFYKTLAGSGKRKSAGVPRTGQACDRCKNRKIRCDDTEGGCLPCRQNNTECRTTDRITQRATVRGHTEAVERENQNLRARIYALQQQVREAGLQAKGPGAFASLPPTDPYGAGWSSYAPPTAGWEQSQVNAHGSTNGFQDPTPPNNEPPDRNIFAQLPPFRSGLGDNYLGVSFKSALSAMEGTRLSVFGHMIDIAQMNTSTSGIDPHYTSLQNVLDHMYQRTDAAKAIKEQTVQLPEHQAEMDQMLEYYMLGMNSFIPLLHRPTTQQLIQNLYNSAQTGFRATPAETVQIHMILAFMYYQYALRNIQTDRAATERQAFQHYNYALCFVNDLLSGRTTEDVIALTMISIFLRTFPKPGPAWIVTNWNFSVAIDIGLHRSDNAWPDTQRSVFEIEQRKRVFWSLMLLHIPLAGKLGRPMLLRLEDYDIEFPEAFNDDMVHEDDPTAQQPCTFRASIDIFKLTEIFAETYAHVYAVRQTTDYKDTVRQINSKIDKWKAQLPAKFVAGTPESTAAQTGILASWMTHYENELLLILHHPALCRSASKVVKARYQDISAIAAEKIVQSTAYLNDHLAYSTSWMDTTTYLAAILTLLFANWERRDRMTSENTASLRKLLETSPAVINNIGTWLGSGHQLHTEVQQTIEVGLRKLENHYAQKTASAASASMKHSPSRSPSTHPPLLKHRQSSQESHIHQQQNQVQTPTTSQYNAAQASPSYPNIHHTYQEPPGPSMQTYSYHPYNTDSTSYNETQQSFMFDANASFANDPYCAPGPHAWRQWNDQLQGNIKSDYDNGSLLLAIGGARTMTQGEDSHTIDAVQGLSGSMASSMPDMVPHPNVQWPMPSGYGMPPHRAM